MSLPAYLSHFIEKSLEGISLNQLKDVIQKVSSKYRDQKVNTFLSTDLERLSYLVFRLPATYKVNERVYKELKKWLTSEIDHYLDVGSGPGTSLWALKNYFEVKNADLLEKDVSLATTSKKILETSEFLEEGMQVNYIHTAMQLFEPSKEYDLVSFSYSLGEIKPPEAEAVLRKFWKKTKKYLVVIEPGTPKGYQDILHYRDVLLKEGGYLLAPCPHCYKCPLSQGDWCHFAERVNRSQAHRMVKSGELGYEDEKYSYIIFSRSPQETPTHRVIRRPIIGKGHVQLSLCAKSGLIENKILTKKEKELFKLAKKVDWGEDLSL